MRYWAVANQKRSRRHAVWIDLLRKGDEQLVKFLAAGMVLSHPFVNGEIALGGLRHRDRLLDELQRLPRAAITTDDEVLRFIDAHALFGRGIGYVDAHLPAAVRLSAGASLWTRDERRSNAARDLALAL